MSKMCIYHGGCDDGFGAAYAVWKKYGDEFEYYPGVYQQDPPDVTGKDVVMVDFSYKIEVIKSMLETANSIFILDHHKTAMDDLETLFSQNIGVTGIFDMNRSGAMMAWQHFHNSEPPPLIQHIQDRDLWQFKIPGTMPISMALRSYEQDFTVWDELMYQTEKLKEEGESITRYHRKKIEEAKPHAWRELIAGYDVPVCNAPYFMASDLAGELSEGEPFAAVFWVSEHGKTYSLRSRENGVDVSEVAKSFGGGGHKNAAGFKCDHDTWIGVPPSMQ